MSKIVHVVAKSSSQRAEQARACYDLGYHAEIYATVDELLSALPSRGIALVADEVEGGGVAMVVEQMSKRGIWLPVIATAGIIDPRRVVDAVKRGVTDYVALPLDRETLAAAIARAEREAVVQGAAQLRAVEARGRLAGLTPRERDVLERLAAGSSNKMIARDLEISPRTVEIHRANMMAKLGASHAADAVRMRLEAAMSPVSAALVAEDLRLAA